MNMLVHSYLVLSVIMFFYMTFWFMVSVVKKRNDVADIAWGLGFLLVALVSFYQHGVSLDRGLLVTTLVAIWALRLSGHIYLRNHGKAEDYRYKAWRDTWGSWFYIRTFFQVFVLQGFLLLLIVSPVVITNVYRGGNFNLLDLLGVIVWSVGFFFEAVGDWQLSHFIQNRSNKDEIMQTGLWRYTRHPNYFGEVTQWWGLWIISLSVAYAWLGIIGPLTISFLILKVSGIPMLERGMSGNPNFEAYKKRVSMFFPLPPRA